MKTISVIGLGYIGLPTAVIAALKGNRVNGFDINLEVIEKLKNQEIHIEERGLQEAFLEATSTGNLVFSSKLEESDVYIITVPTPTLIDPASDFPGPDLSHVRSAINLICEVLKPGDLIILESTSPVGTTEGLLDYIGELRPDLSLPKPEQEFNDISLAYCPERVMPGNIIEELQSNVRIIGGITKNCADAAADVYDTFVRSDCIKTSVRTAEMVKLTENASRDVQIAFANELSLICDENEIDVWELIKLANLHPRVNILNPGPGVGGHCIAVDPWFIVSNSPKNAKIISLARQINDSKPDFIVSKVLTLVSEISKGKDLPVIVCYGLTFKADIDDIRESPSLKIIEKLSSLYAGELFVVDPHVTSLPSSINNAALIDFEKVPYSTDIHLLLVDHEEFLDSKPETGHIIDTRGIW